MEPDLFQRVRAWRSRDEERRTTELRGVLAGMREWLELQATAVAASATAAEAELSDQLSRSKAEAVLARSDAVAAQERAATATIAARAAENEVAALQQQRTSALDRASEFQRACTEAEARASAAKRAAAEAEERLSQLKGEVSRAQSSAELRSRSAVVLRAECAEAVRKAGGAEALRAELVETAETLAAVQGNADAAQQQQVASAARIVQLKEALARHEGCGESAAPSADARTAEVRPVVPEMAQPADEATPVEDEATPVEDEAAPAEDEATPAEDEATPVEDEAAPAEDEAAPAEANGTPAEDAVTPPEDDVTPAEDEATPVEDEAAPAEDEAAPAEDEAAPAEDEAAPAEDEAAPAEDEAAPAEDEAGEALLAPDSDSDAEAPMLATPRARQLAADEQLAKALARRIPHTPARVWAAYGIGRGDAGDTAGKRRNRSCSRSQQPKRAKDSSKPAGRKRRGYATPEPEAEPGADASEVVPSTPKRRRKRARTPMKAATPGTSDPQAVPPTPGIKGRLRRRKAVNYAQ